MASRRPTGLERMPSGLGTAGKCLWRKITADFVLEDAAGAELLLQAAIAADRAAQAREALAKSGGCVVQDRFGKPARHPGVTIERDAVGTMLACLKALGLQEIGPKNRGGRPSGS